VIGWKNIALNRSVSATSAALGFPAIAARTYASYEGWKPVGSAGTFTMTANATIDYIGLFFQGSGTVQLSYVTGGNTIIVGIFPASGAVFALINDASVTSVIITVSGFSGYLANVMLGRYTEIQRRIYVGHRPISYGRNVDRVQGLSESGQFLGHIVRRKTKTTRVDISNLTPEYYQNVLDEFIEASTSQPHYWSYRRDIPQAGADPLTPISLIWGSLTMVWGTSVISLERQPLVSATDQAAWAQVQGNPDVDNSLSNGMMSAGWDIVAL
jgi:hypothetical protein